jgi:predicted nuclease with TOPRIM domain
MECKEAAGTLVIDETAKGKAEIQKEIGEARGELSAGDYKVTKAAEKGLTLEELYPGEMAKRDALRTKINELEARISEFAA